MDKYNESNNRQRSRRCFGILERSYQGKSDFRGLITFEDGQSVWIDVCVANDRAAQDYLRLLLRPQLSKTPLSADAPKTRQYFATLYRTSPKCYQWQSDFKGSLLREGRLYEVGVYVRADRAGRQFLKLFLRAELSREPGAPSSLEVVK
jgi:hypothetical protein